MHTVTVPPAERVDAARAVVLPGPGAAVRLPGLLCLLRLDPAADGDGQLARLVEICTEISSAQPAVPGRPLARRLARWLGSLDEGPDFGTVAATETGIALFLHGRVDAVVGGERYSATDAGAWLDRLLPYPDGRLMLLATDDETPGNGTVRAVYDLRGGVVPAGAVLLVPRSGAMPLGAGTAPQGRSALAAAAPVAPVVAAPAPAAPIVAPDAAAPAVAPDAAGPVPSAPAPVPGAAPAAARRVSSILGVAPDETPRTPLDAGSGRAPTAPRPSPTKRTPPADPAGNGAPMAYGHLCARDHLNDPRNHFCVVCGIRMDERTGVEVLGVRPPLGVLVFDDGSTWTLDTDYLLGRMPESDPRVVGGELRALTVDDPDAQLSRGHLVIKLDGWDVTAIDESRNGTLVARPSEASWSRLTPRQPLRLLPGTRVRVGGRSFVFESPSGVR